MQARLSQPCRTQPERRVINLASRTSYIMDRKYREEQKGFPMAKLRTLALLIVVAHGIVAIWHLFLAARILPPPNNNVSWMAIILLTPLHLTVAIALWKLSTKFTGLASLIFFLAALAADLYEHFLHASPNNVFTVAPGNWTAWFDASVYVLLALEILGCSLGILLRGDRARNNKSDPKLKSNLGKQGTTPSSSKFDALTA